ncbi:MAG: helix-turn-helix domain-containing protein [Microcella sp.]
MSSAGPRIPRQLCETIREVRHDRGWSQTTLGDRAGLSRPTIARVERGDDISTATLVAISEALGLSIELRRIA